MNACRGTIVSASYQKLERYVEPSFGRLGKRAFGTCPPLIPEEVIQRMIREKVLKQQSKGVADVFRHLGVSL